jgi:hypothetical protein
VLVAQLSYAYDTALQYNASLVLLLAEFVTAFAVVHFASMVDRCMVVALASNNASKS